MCMVFRFLGVHIFFLYFFQSSSTLVVAFFSLLFFSFQFFVFFSSLVVFWLSMKRWRPLIVLMWLPLYTNKQHRQSCFDQKANLQIKILLSNNFFFRFSSCLFCFLYIDYIFYICIYRKINEEEERPKWTDERTNERSNERSWIGHQNQRVMCAFNDTRKRIRQTTTIHRCIDRV